LKSLYIGPEVRAWQKEAICEWEKHNCGIIQAVPGAGKTMLAVKIICNKLVENPELKILIVCPRLSLIQQWVDSIVSYSKIKNSDIYEISSNTEKQAYFKVQEKINHHKIFISTFNQIKQFFKEYGWKEKEWLLIVDEMHNTSENYKFPNLSIKYKLGLSATPKKRKTDSDFNLGGIVYTYSFSRALQDKIILDPVIKIVSYSVSEKLFKSIENNKESTIDLAESAFDDFLPENLYESFMLPSGEKKINDKINFGDGEVGDEQLKEDLKSSDVNVENNDLFTSKNIDFVGIQKILENKFNIGKKNSAQTLVFVNRIKKADLLNRIISESFSKKISHSYHSKSQNYKNKNNFNNIKKQFSENKFNVLISVGTLGEGIDFPYASHGIIASPIYNSSAFVQKVGRLLRTYEGHKKAIIYYYVPSELITRLITDERIEPNYFKAIIKIADENNNLYFVDRESLKEEKGNLDDLLMMGSAYERNEFVKKIKIPSDLDSIMRFFKRVSPEKIKYWKEFYSPVSKSKKDKSKKDKSGVKNLVLGDDEKINKGVGKNIQKIDKDIVGEIDFSLLRKEISNSCGDLIFFAENILQQLKQIKVLQNNFYGKKFNEVKLVKEFVRVALKQQIITKIKYGYVLEEIDKHDSSFSISEQEMLVNMVSAELQDFCSRKKSISNAIKTIEEVIQSIEKVLIKEGNKNNFNGKFNKKLKNKSFSTNKSKNDSLEEKEMDIKIKEMNKFAKCFFNLQSIFLDEFDFSTFSKISQNDGEKIILTIGKDIFLSKRVNKIYSYPEDFGLSRWKEEEIKPVKKIILSPVELFVEELVKHMSEEKDYSKLSKNWDLIKKDICLNLNIPLQDNSIILNEIEKQKHNSKFSFEEIFFISEALKLIK
jgi:superfamily II DNA or RNA helicase